MPWSRKASTARHVLGCQSAGAARCLELGCNQESRENVSLGLHRTRSDIGTL